MSEGGGEGVFEGTAESVLEGSSDGISGCGADNLTVVEVMGVSKDTTEDVTGNVPK